MLYANITAQIFSSPRQYNIYSSISNLYQPISPSTILGSKMGKKYTLSSHSILVNHLLENSSSCEMLTDKSGFVGPERHSYISHQILLREGKNIPSGMMESVMGRVSRAFLPYWSDRFPITGVIIIAPNPMICIITLC